VQQRVLKRSRVVGNLDFDTVSHLTQNWSAQWRSSPCSHLVFYIQVTHSMDVKTRLARHYPWPVCTGPPYYALITSNPWFNSRLAIQLMHEYWQVSKYIILKFICTKVKAESHWAIFIIDVPVNQTTRYLVNRRRTRLQVEIPVP